MANQSQHQQNQITSLASTLSPLLPTSTHPSLSNSVIPSLLASLQTVASALRDSQKISQAGTANAFGDEQLNVDVQAENAIRAALAACPAVVTASSEEDPREVATNPSASASRGAASGEDEEVYTAAFDPLDGSSIIAPNWTVGSIIGLWRGRSALNSSPKENQIASILGVYGPRTTAIVAWRVSPTESRCFEIGLGGSSAADVSCEIVRPEITYASPPFKTRYFAPANLRAASEEPRYASLIQSYISEKYTLRYSGGLVPDVVHALVKGHGVYVSPVTEGCKAKLRRLYELAPLALVVECAGGKAVDSASGEVVLEREVRDCDERGGIVCGNGEEVGRVREAFGLM